MNRLKRELAKRLGEEADILAMTAYPEIGLVGGQDQDLFAEELREILRQEKEPDANRHPR